jgi:hypothetical protein
MYDTFDLTDYNEQRLRELEYRVFLETPYWRSVAAAVKARDGRKCVVCNSPRKIAAHHRTYAHHGAEHLHLGDLTTLCDDCHQRHHFPPPPPQVVVKTVVQIRQVPVQPWQPQSVPPGESYWHLLSKQEKRFYRKAAIKLGRKARKLYLLGRATVFAMLAGKPAPCSAKPQEAAPKLNGFAVVGDLASVEADMPAGEEIVLTRALIRKCQANGSFTTATLKALGFTDVRNMKSGWTRELEGKTVPRAVLYEAMRGRHLYSPSTLKKRDKRGAPPLPISAPVPTEP